MQKFLAPVLLVFPLLGGFGKGLVLAVTNNPLGILEGHRPIVKVEEGCGNGYFRDGYGNCHYWYGGEPAHRPPRGVPAG